jgi:ribosomal protein L40E
VSAATIEGCSVLKKVMKTSCYARNILPTVSSNCRLTLQPNLHQPVCQNTYQQCSYCLDEQRYPLPSLNGPLLGKQMTLFSVDKKICLRCSQTHNQMNTEGGVWLTSGYSAMTVTP